jgi:hypothetical protein
LNQGPLVRKDSTDMWHYEPVMSERNTASLDTKASDAVSERLGGFALIGLGPTASESSTSGGSAGNACSLLVDRLSQLTTGAAALNRDGNSWAR